MLRRLPAYLRLAWRLGRDPLLSRARRAAILAAAGYLASPIDLVPGVIPVLGQLDDLAVAIAALRLALDGLHPERRRMHLEAVGLVEADLADDLRTIGATTAWIARAAARLTARVVVEGGHAVATGVAFAARSTRTAAGRLAGAARPRVRDAGTSARARATGTLGAVGRTARRIRPAGG
jgi:uncharacterized membrane protein YkvA (DUF1232 family)